MPIIGAIRCQISFVGGFKAREISLWVFVPIPIGVLLDGVGDALILKGNRESLQGRAKLCKGAQSATNMYSYVYTLHKRGIVATFDMSARNLDALKIDHWLSNSKNIIQLFLEEKSFREPEPELVPVPAFPGAAAPASPAARPAKRRWGSPGNSVPGLAI